MIEFTPAQAAPRIASLLAAHESRTLDFKRVSGKMVGKALEAICAFANTEGGILALGVADEKQENGTARIYGVEPGRVGTPLCPREYPTAWADDNPVCPPYACYDIKYRMGLNGQEDDADD